MNRREKANLTERLAEQYLRSHKPNFNNGEDNMEYTMGWRDAVRSCAVASGVYNEFVKKIEKPKNKPKDDREKIYG